MFLGSYSYQTVESARLRLGPADLAEAIDHDLPAAAAGNDLQNCKENDLENGNDLKKSSAALRRIRFAGEATHENHFSTVHGAIESGWREAEIILNNVPKVIHD